jgi:hypothetical protein
MQSLGLRFDPLTGRAGPGRNFVDMTVEDYYVQGRRSRVRLHERGGKQHDMPAHTAAASENESGVYERRRLGSPVEKGWGRALY